MIDNDAWLQQMFGRQAARPDPREAELRRLRARCEELERRCEALEQALRGAPADRLRLGLSRQQQVMVDLLMRQSVVTVEQALAALEAAVPTDDGRPDDNVHVAMSRLRAGLRRWGVPLHSRRHGGYWLDPADKTRLREAQRP